MQGIIRVFLLSASLSVLHVNAAVLDKSVSGFIIEIQAETDQSQKLSYQQFLRIDEWWDGDHSWFGDAANFYLEPRVGGCFCEVDGDRQAHHMSVTYIEPNKEVRMIGGLGPLQMMAVSGAMSWQFKSQENGMTLIVHRYTVSGYHKDGLDKLAPIVDQVQAGQLNRLIEILDSRGKP